MESGLAGIAMTGDDQWQDITGHRTAPPKARRHKPRRLPRKRVSGKTWRTKENSATADSTPMMVADFTFRKQIEWLMENAGVCDNFKDVAQNIWFSYLSQYMPDVKNGLEVELAGNLYWHLAYPLGDLAALLHCSRRDLREKLEKLQQSSSVSDEDPVDVAQGSITEATRLTKHIAHLNVQSISNHLQHRRPTASFLLAVLVIACHICREEILLSDLLRWARLLKLPLLDMAPYGAASKAELRGLPYARYGEKSSSQGVAKYSHVERKVTWLAFTLLKEKVSFLPGLPVAPFVERFIEELNLPWETIPLVLGLLDRINCAKYQIESTSFCQASGYKRGKNIECHLMCCIFYTLRILCVLDDCTEKQMSQATERMQELIPSVKLFNFGVWYQHLMHRRLLLFKHTMLSRHAWSTTAYADFVQLKQAPVSDSKAKGSQVIKNWKVRERQMELVDSLHKLEIHKKSSSLLIDLPATVRPYRAHTEALSEHYPELAVDFSQHSIKHLLDDQSWTEQLKPDGIAADVRAEVQSMQRVREIAYSQMFMLRFFRNRDHGRQKLVEEDNLPRIVRDLARTLTDMIDQDYEYFFGSLVFLELAFFPNNSLCKKGKHSRNLKHMKTV